MTPTLRPYQQQANDAIVGALLDQGQTRVLLKMATGTGKTVTFAELLKHPRLAAWLAGGPRKGASLLVIAHREELLRQAQEKIQRANPGLSVMIEQGEYRASRYSDVVIASIQTLAARKYHRLQRLMLHHKFRVVICDECFPAGTLVEGRPIEAIKVGDLVTAYDPETGTVAQRRVLATMSREPIAGLLRITSDGRQITCTPNHKIFTARGWQRADALTHDDMMATITEPHYGQRPNWNDGILSSVPSADDFAEQATSRYLPEKSPRLLLGPVPGPDGLRGVIGADGEDEPRACVGPDEGAQSHALAGEPGEDANHAAHDAMETSPAWRERQAPTVAATGIGGGAGLADRGSDQDEGGTPERHVSKRLQAGHRECRLEDRDRGGRLLARSRQSAITGPEERGVLRWSRVDDLEVLESGSDRRFGGLCRDGLVYNLTVEDVHTYTANGFVVANCHHAAAATYRTVFALLGFLPMADASDSADSEAVTFEDVAVMEQALQGWDTTAPKDQLLLGVTATPNRSDAIGLSCVFQTIAYNYGLKQAIDEGYLVPLTPWVVETAESLDNVKIVRGDFNQRELADTVNTPRRNALTVASWQTYAKGRATIAFTVDVSHAHALAQAYTLEGISARAVSGETPSEERRQILADFTAGKIQVVTNCMVLTEGTDLPIASCIVHAKPTKSATLYEQMTGRGLRPYPGKSDCVVIDLVDVARRHSLQSAPVLYGLPPGLKTKGDDLRKVADELDALRRECPSLDIEAALREQRWSIEDLRKRASTFDVWAIPDLGALAQVVSLNWIRVGTDTYRLSYPWSDGTETVTVSPDVLGHFDVALELRPQGMNASPRQRTLAAQVVTVVEALALAEAFVKAERPTVLKLKDREAPWTKRPASPKQIAYLAKLRVPVKAGITMGEASGLIDLQKARRR